MKVRQWNSPNFTQHCTWCHEKLVNALTKRFFSSKFYKLEVQVPLGFFFFSVPKNDIVPTLTSSTSSYKVS